MKTATGRALRAGGTESEEERRRPAPVGSRDSTAKRASTSPNITAAPATSGASVTRAPFTRVPFALPRSRTTQPFGVFSTRAWRRETERLARRISQSGSRPITARSSKIWRSAPPSSRTVNTPGMIRFSLSRILGRLGNPRRIAFDDDGAEHERDVSDVRSRRPGRERFAERLKEGTGVVVEEGASRVESERSGARERRAVDEGTRCIRIVVDAVRPGAKHRHAGG